MKKIVYFLAFFFLVEWAYTTKLKPFVIGQFGPFGNKADSSVKTAEPVSSGNWEPGPLATPGSHACGLDIYHLTGKGYEVSKINREKDSIDFVICKATEGSGFLDTSFAGNWKILKNKGIIRGAYHLYHCENGAVEQAEFFCRTINSITGTDLPPVIDIESPETNSRCAGYSDSLLVFLKMVEHTTGKKPMIYVNVSDGDAFLRNPVFAAYSLWVAYPTNTRKAPKLPDLWDVKGKGWTIWQRSDSVKFDGNKNDYDIFNGNLDDLNKFISSSNLKAVN